MPQSLPAIMECLVSSKTCAAQVHRKQVASHGAVQSDQGATEANSLHSVLRVPVFYKVVECFRDQDVHRYEQNRHIDAHSSHHTPSHINAW